LSERARIRINLAQRELEVEGSEGFVRGYGARLEVLLDRLTSGTALAAPVAMPRDEPPAGPLDFPEFLLRLPGSATEVDTMLAAGYWVQQRSADDAFTTAEANRRLLEHGVKLGNPSQCVKQSLLAKRLFQVQKGRYRISQQGRTHLRQLLGSLIPEARGD
jgi:hypothetical protein